MSNTKPKEQPKSETPENKLPEDETPETKEVRDEKAVAPVAEPVIKRGWQKVHAKGFVGNYKGVVFDDEGICPRITDATLEALQADYPGLKVKVID